MPRLTKSLPKYRKHSASGQAIVTIAGRAVYLGPYDSKASKLEYDRVVGEWVAAGRPSHAVETANDITLAEVMAAYLRYVKRRYVKNGKPTSQQYAIKSAMRPLKVLYAETPAAEFGPLALKAVRDKMIADGISRDTANSYTSCLQRMFKWAASEELIPASVPLSLATISGLRKGESKAPEPKPILPVDDSIVDATLPHLRPTIADMVRLQRLTGMRPGEVCILRPCDIDRSSDVWTYRPESHKTEHHERDRIVFIGPKAQAILRPYLLRAEDAYCFSPSDSERRRSAERRENRHSPMTPSQRKRTRKSNRKRPPGKCYAVSSYRCAIKRACKKAKLSSWHPNQLRHATATEIRKKYGLEAAQVSLGHATADITQIYAERDSTLAAKIAKEVG